MDAFRAGEIYLERDCDERFGVVVASEEYSEEICWMQKQNGIRGPFGMDPPLGGRLVTPGTAPNRKRDAQN